MTIKLDLRIESDLWAALPECDEICQIAANAPGIAGSVDLLLTDNSAMQVLNREWRGKDKPTDVLSFPSEEDDSISGSGSFLGDVAIGYEISLADAEAAEKTLAAHLSHLIIHGILHLAGYDHIDDVDAEEMEALEISALARLGYGNPYTSNQDMA